jgi:hypothetical protein
MNPVAKKVLPKDAALEVLEQFYIWEMPFRVDCLFYTGFNCYLLETHNRASVDDIGGVKGYEQENDWIEVFGDREDLAEVITEAAEYAAKRNLKPGFTEWYKELKKKLSRRD